jgi:phospholipid/cholesterol/gamma-HCH transport system substrate-binding protein
MSPRRGVSWSQLRIGLFVTVSVTVTALAVFFIDNVRQAFEDRYTLHFHTITTQALRPRAAVWLAGQAVGQVDGLFFEPPTEDAEGRLRVRLSIDVAVQHLITEGAVAQVTTAGLLGEAVVNILPADEPGPPLVEGAALPAASELADPSEVGRRLSTVFDSVKPVADRWGEVFDQALYGPGSLRRMMERPQELRDLQTNLRHMAATFDTLSSAAGGLAELVSDDEVRASLGRLGPRVKTLAEDWGHSEGTLGALVSDSTLVQRLRSIQGNIDRISVRVETGRGTLGRLINDQALALELAETREMLEELKADLRAFASGERQPPP